MVCSIKKNVGNGPTFDYGQKEPGQILYDSANREEQPVICG